MKDNKSNSKETFIRLVAVLLILIGAGNLLYAQSRFREYSFLTQRASGQLRSEPLPALTTNSQLLRVEKRKAHYQSRAQFYNLVRYGGATMITLGTLLLLPFLLLKLFRWPKTC